MLSLGSDVLMVLISFHFLSGDPDCLPAAAPGRAHPPPHAAPDPPGISEDRERRGEVLLAAGFFYTEENPEPQTLFRHLNTCYEG